MPRLARYKLQSLRVESVSKMSSLQIRLSCKSHRVVGAVFGIQWFALNTLTRRSRWTVNA